LGILQRVVLLDGFGEILEGAGESLLEGGGLAVASLLVGGRGFI
jgi:hypothetical protein